MKWRRWLRLHREQLREKNEPEEYDRDCTLPSDSAGEVRATSVHSRLTESGI
jgi:hypothetical protein